MNFRTCAFVAAAISLSACGKETPDVAAPAPVEAKQFLEGVPADTPYVSASITPAPLADVLPWVQTLDDAAMPTSERVAELMADENLKPRKRRALAFLAEMTGHYTPEGFQELGFSSTPRLAVYGIGLLPALRLEVSDETKVLAFIERVHARAGLTAERRTIDGESYWAVPGDRADREMVYAFKDGTLLAGVTNAAAEKTYVRTLLGLAPGDSLTDASLESVASTWGLQTYSVGFVDLQRIAATVLAPGNDLNGEIFRALRPEHVTTDACRAETSALVESVPRFIFGSESWARDAVSFGAAIETNHPLAGKLAETRRDAPLAGEAAGAGTVGFGFHLGAVFDVVRETAQQVANQPFECSWYAPVNRVANKLSSRWTILPPAIADITGATVLLKDMRPPDDATKWGAEVDLVAAITTSSPTALLDLAKGFDTDLNDMTLPPSGEFAEVPDSRFARRLHNPKVLARPQALAITSGEWSPDDLGQLSLEAQPAPFFFLRYDAEFIASRTGHEGAVAPIRKALRGQSALELNPTPTGFHFRSTYKRETAVDE